MANNQYGVLIFGTMNEPNTARLSQSLERDTSTRKYRLGPRVLDLGFSVLASLELREIAGPYLRRLTDTTGHTSNLARPGQHL